MYIQMFKSFQDCVLQINSKLRLCSIRVNHATRITIRYTYLYNLYYNRLNIHIETEIVKINFCKLFAKHPLPSTVN